MRYKQYNILYLLALITMVMGCAQEEEQPPWNNGQLTTFGNTPLFSPDGTMIIFGGDDGQSAGLWLYTLGQGAEILYEGPFTYDYTWSPASDQIAFSDPGGAERTLWLLDLSGNLTELVQNGRNPSWSPDGSLIAYQDGSGVGIYKIPAGGGTPLAISYYGEYPRWSPDGEYIAFRTGTGVDYTIYLWSTVSGITSELISGGSHFDWSPDGNSIVYEIYEMIAPSGYYLNLRRTNVVAPYGELLWQGGVEPKWSPNGASIVFRALSGFSSGGLLIIPAEGGSAEQITSNGYGASFSPEGDIIAFSRSNEGVWLASTN